jgi:sulfate transport system ATP-binding protein
VLLLDEPFGALDANVRAELRAWLRRLHDEVHVTSLFVTHDQQEAFEVSDQLVLLDQGRVQQAGPPQHLYDRPATPFVARFLGQINALALDAAHGKPRADANADRSGVVYVRPHNFEVHSHPNGWPCWSARVERATPLGGVVRVDLRLDDSSPVLVEVASDRWRRLAVPERGEVFLSPLAETGVG